MVIRGLLSLISFFLFLVSSSLSWIFHNKQAALASKSHTTTACKEPREKRAKPRHRSLGIFLRFCVPSRVTSGAGDLPRIKAAQPLSPSAPAAHSTSRRSPVALDRATVAPPLNVTQSLGGEGEHAEGSLCPLIFKRVEPLIAATVQSCTQRC